MATSNGHSSETVVVVADVTADETNIDTTASGTSSSSSDSSVAAAAEKAEKSRCCGRRLCKRVREGWHNFQDELQEPIEDVNVYGRRCLKKSCTKDAFLGKFPIIKWLPKYRWKQLQGDFIAGVTVGLTVIPQGLAYAQVAELSPEYGLYSAFMGCFIYMFLGTSKDITLGPTAIMSLMTAEFGKSPVEHDPTYAILLSFIGGIIQLLMGIVQIGFVVDYISHPVINSFTTAAAITIAWSQIKIMGFSNGTDVHPGFVCTEARNAIVVVLASVAAVVFLQYNLKPFFLTGNIKAGLPVFKPPSFTLKVGNDTLSSSEVLGNLGPGLIIVPVLGLVETIAIGKAFARKYGYTIDANQELLAVGASNIVGSFIGAYPVTGSFSRTAVNAQSGVMTTAGGIWTAVLVLLALAFLTPLFYYIPDAALAAVIIMAVIDMVDFSLLRKLWRIKKIDLIPWIVTFICSLCIGIEWGIIIGIGLSLLFILYPWARPKFHINLVQLPNDDMIVMTLNQGLVFPGIEHFKDKVYSKALSGETNKSVVLDFNHITNTDFTAVEGMHQLLEDFAKKKKKLVVCNLQPQVLDVFTRAKLKHFEHTASVDEAIALIQSENEKASISDGAISPTATGDEGSPTELLETPDIERFTIYDDATDDEDPTDDETYERNYIVTAF